MRISRLLRRPALKRRPDNYGTARNATFHALFEGAGIRGSGLSPLRENLYVKRTENLSPGA